jgi:cytochrome c biogenesis protein CcmG, thiol:disulfide interchange protein DsbE
MEQGSSVGQAGSAARILPPSRFPCRSEMPVLDPFYRRYHDQGVELLGLRIDDLHDRGDVGRIMQRFSYPAALMATAKVNGFGSPLAVPMTYVIDSKGTVRARLLAGNAVTDQSLAQTVLPLLSQGPATALKP